MGLIGLVALLLPRFLRACVRPVVCPLAGMPVRQPACHGCCMKPECCVLSLAGLRIGLYAPMKRALGAEGKESSALGSKVAAGMLSGAIAAGGQPVHAGCCARRQCMGQL